MRVQEVMTRDPCCVTPDASVSEAALVMQRENTGAIPVVDAEDSKRLVGILTDRDIAIRVVAESRDGNTTVSEIMSASGLATCGPDADIDEVMNTMAREQVRRIPVVDERGSLIGIVAQADIVRKSNDASKAQRTVSQISEPSRRHSQ